MSRIETVHRLNLDRSINPSKTSNWKGRIVTVLLAGIVIGCFLGGVAASGYLGPFCDFTHKQAIIAAACLFSGGIVGVFLANKL